MASSSPPLLCPVDSSIRPGAGGFREALLPGGRPRPAASARSTPRRALLGHLSPRARRNGCPGPLGQCSALGRLGRLGSRWAQLRPGSQMALFFPQRSSNRLDQLINLDALSGLRLEHQRSRGTEFHPLRPYYNEHDPMARERLCHQACSSAPLICHIDSGGSSSSRKQRAVDVWSSVLDACLGVRVEGWWHWSPRAIFCACGNLCHGNGPDSLAVVPDPAGLRRCMAP